MPLISTCHASEHTSSQSRPFSLIAASLLMVLLIGFSMQANAEPAVPGNWATNYGPLQIYGARTSRIAGTYFYKRLPAHLYARQRADGLYEGVWIQGTSEIRCRRKALGSPYWGRVRFQFTGSKFYALWNYCGRRLVKRQNHFWKGVLAIRYGSDEAKTKDLSKVPLEPRTDDRYFEGLQSKRSRPESKILEDLPRQ